MHALVLTLVLAGAADNMALPPPASTETQMTCNVWANTKADTAGVVQVLLTAGRDGKGSDGFDGYPMLVKLADNRARICRFGATLKLADRMLATYQVIPEPRPDNCLLLVELGKRAVIHDRKGTCAKALCGNDLKLDNLTFPFDPKTKTCTVRRQ